MGILYLVATPIGNLEDISARALRVLREVTLIAAEDTRHTRKLLSASDIHTPLTSYYEQTKLTKMDVILEALQLGSVALVSDAGTPGLNDPGVELVQAALAAGHTVSPIPGPAAPIAALVASGLPTDNFLYLGYLPRKPAERRQLFADIANLPYTLIFLESPHRLLDSLADLRAGLGDRPVAVARELTKLYEEIFRGPLSAASDYFTQTGARGEFTLVIGGNRETPGPWDEKRLVEAIRADHNKDLAPSELAQRLARESGWSRRDIYRLITQVQSQ